MGNGEDTALGGLLGATLGEAFGVPEGEILENALGVSDGDGEFESVFVGKSDGDGEVLGDKSLDGDTLGTRGDAFDSHEAKVLPCATKTPSKKPRSLHPPRFHSPQNLG